MPERYTYRCTACGNDLYWEDTVGQTGFTAEVACRFCQNPTADRVLRGLDLPRIVEHVLMAVAQSQTFSQWMAEEERRRAPDLTIRALPDEPPILASGFGWSGEISFDTLPETEKEMRAQIREKLGPIGDYLLQAWQKCKGQQDG